MDISSEPSNRQIRKAVYSLALPIVWSNFLQRGVGIIDAMMVGHLGPEELAGVGMSQLFVFLMSAMNMATGIGTMILVAHATGANQPDKRCRSAGTGIAMGIGISAILSVLGYIFSYKAAVLMGATHQVALLAEDYLNIIFIFFIARGLIYILSSIFQGSGDSKTPLNVIIWVNIIHIIIAYPLIYGLWISPLKLLVPSWGVKGAAFATGLTEIGGAVVLFALALKKGLVHFSLCRINSIDFKKIVRLGVPVFIERTLLSSMQMVYARMVVSFSVAAYAAHQVGFNIEALSFLPGQGFAQGATALVGQSLGAKKPKRAKRVGYQTSFIALVVMTLFGASYLIIPRFWVGLFTNDPSVVAYGITFCYIVAFVQPPLASSLAFAGALRGAGETRFVMYTSIFGSWFIRLPFAYIFGIYLGGGIVWVWLAMIADWLVRVTVLFWRYRRGKPFRI